MFCFHELHFLLVGLSDWGCTKTLVISEYWIPSSLALAGYQYRKYATDPSLLNIHKILIALRQVTTRIRKEHDNVFTNYNLIYTYNTENVYYHYNTVVTDTKPVRNPIFTQNVKELWFYIYLWENINKRNRDLTSLSIQENIAHHECFCKYAVIDFV